MVTKKTTKKKTKETAVTPEIWPKVVIGTHLSVITYENGEVELIWDDDKLLEEVRAAIESDRKSTRLNSSHSQQSRMPSSA